MNKLANANKAYILEQQEHGLRTWDDFFKMSETELSMALGELLKKRDRRLGKAQEKALKG